LIAPSAASHAAFTTVPAALVDGRAIGDMTALGMADVVAGAVRKLGRR